MNLHQTFARNRNLFYLLAPLSLLAIASLIFEHGVAPQESYIEYTKDFFGPQSDFVSALNMPKEIRARFIWLLSCIVLIASSLAAILVACFTIADCLPKKRCRNLLIAAAALAVIELSYLSFLPNDLRTLNFNLTLDLLKNVKIYQAGFIQTNVANLAFAVVALSTVAAMFLLVAASSTVILPDDKPVLIAARQHMARLKNVLYVGSVMLVSGVINMGAWMRWPAALFRQHPDKGDAFADMALGLTTFWGATFTVVTIAAYVLPALYLRSRAAQVHAQQYPEASFADREKWLGDEGFTMSVGSKPGPVIAMAGPLLAGPLSAVFNTLGTQLTQ